MKITKTEFEQLLDKIVSSLTTHFNDPKVIDYNFYNNANGVGVKMVRKGKKMTIEDLALTVYNLTLEVRAGFAKQEEFNQEVRNFMRDQKIFNEKLLSLPTIKKEMAELK